VGERVSDDGISFDQGSYRILGGATKQVNARLTRALPGPALPAIGPGTLFIRAELLFNKAVTGCK
jgi:hypothetical protein